MEYDNYVIEVNGEEKKIFPLLEANVSGKIFLFYSKEIKENYSKEDLYVGEEIDGCLKPVPDSYMPILNDFFDKTVDTLDKNNLI